MYGGRFCPASHKAGLQRAARQGHAPTGAGLLDTSSIVYARGICHKFVPSSRHAGGTVSAIPSTPEDGTISIGEAILLQDVFGLRLRIFKLWLPAILPSLVCGMLQGKVSPCAGAPASSPGLSLFLWSGKVLGEPFGIPANFIDKPPCPVPRPTGQEGLRGRGPLHPHINQRPHRRGGIMRFD